ncbi:uncharacterized protein LOC103308580 [Acyrthosiphon pisum]|uniref:Uncharacterized protein n=1 Tax=Acyrthosiphon pisum TaxID=7029 RepID=A0A8R2B034_ACYPI|nr:uncharacterized protein LOC103308580 [Acyrthosiphon pisum]|eukprot:XP_008180445.1 PREDICTED: uncharacterized protein LOC103308580 [Acyrthosiphon pisum]
MRSYPGGQVVRMGVALFRGRAQRVAVVETASDHMSDRHPLHTTKTDRCRDLKKIEDLQREVDLLKNARINTDDKSHFPMDLLSQLVATQKLISENICVSNINSQVQRISTNDTASAISQYYGKSTKMLKIGEVERISSHAHWLESLTLGKRILRKDELIVEYIFDKDTIIKKAPFKMQQLSRVSLILEGITDNIWSVPLATWYSSQCCTHGTLKGEESRKEKTNSSLHPSIDKKEDQFYFKCKSMGHISYECHSTNSVSKKKDSNKFSANNIKLTKSKHQTEKKKQDSANSRSINFIATDFINISQIPVIINGSITIDALPDNGSCVTLLRKCFVPKDAVIHEWQDGPYATPEGDCTPSSWITLRIQVGKIDYTMPKVGLCESLPIAMILGRDWQAAVHATITIELNGVICINTPSTSQEYDNKPLISKSLTLVNSKSKSDIVTNDFLSSEEKQVIEKMLLGYNDIFSTSENEIGEFPDFHTEINLTNDNPIKCKPYKASEIDKQFMRKQVEKWIKSGVCRNSTSPYGAPAFVIEQPHHESTPIRFIVDYSRTINPFTIKDPFPINKMDDMIHKIAGKKYKSLADVKHAFNHFKVREEDILKTASVTPEHHIEFCRVLFAKYYDDLATAHDTFEEHIQLIHSLFEATRKYNLKFTRKKCEFAVPELKILGRIIDSRGDRPDPNRTQAVSRYQTLKFLNELCRFLEFANTLRRYIKNFAQIAKPLTDKLKTKHFKTDHKIKNTVISLNEKELQAFVKLKTALITAPILAHFEPDAPTSV